MDKYLDSVLLLGGEVNSLLHPAISEVGGEGRIVEFFATSCNIRGRRGGGELNSLIHPAISEIGGEGESS